MRSLVYQPITVRRNRRGFRDSAPALYMHVWRLFSLVLRTRGSRQGARLSWYNVSRLAHHCVRYVEDLVFRPLSTRFLVPCL